jgi:aspartate aminotransferase
MANNKNNSPKVNLNLNVRGLARSATLRINELSNQLIHEGRQVYKLGLGQSPFPVPQSVQDELKAQAHQKDYLPVLGLRSLQNAVADYFHRVQGVNFTPGNIMIGPGSKELMFILQLVYYGDLVIPTPSWVSYAPQAHIIGRHITWIPTALQNNWQITADKIEEICSNDPDRPRLIILNYPANPHGFTYSISALRDIARVSRKYGIVLLSDEIYGELHHKGEHVSIARFYPEGTIISSGLSKWCGAGGWRLGTFAFPKSLDWLKEAMAVVASETYTSTSAPIQYAAVRAFKGGQGIEKYLWNSRRILASLGKVIVDRLRKAGVKIKYPHGAFYLFPDFEPFRQKLLGKGIHNSEQFCNQLLQDTGVAVLPGSVFGRPTDELTVRIAYVDFDGSRILQAVSGMSDQGKISESFLEVHCPSCLNGIDRLCDWLQN